MKIIVLHKFLFLTCLLSFICLGCKKYTKNQERYIITLESNVLMDKAAYTIKTVDKGSSRFVDTERFGPVVTGGFTSFDGYQHILDTVLVTDDLSFIDISYSFELLPGETVDAFINVTMLRTKTNEILFQKSFHEDYKSGSLTINL